MNRQIAVLLDAENNPAAFHEAKKAVVYEKQTEWKAILTPDVIFTELTSAGFWRKTVESLAQAISPCKIIAGKSLSGIAYQVFDRLGFSIFEIDTVNDAVLDGILSDHAAETEKEAAVKAEFPCEPGTPQGPIETDIPGVFSFDLVAFQEKNSALSSKKALYPFFNEVPFEELILTCNHIPPWIEQKGYAITSETVCGGKLTAHIKINL